MTPLAAIVLCGASAWASSLSAQTTPHWQSAAYGTCAPSRTACSLKANLTLLRESGARTFVVEKACAYDPDASRWSTIDVSPHQQLQVAARPGTGQVDPSLLDLPLRIGLFWVQWREDGRLEQTQIFSGPILCQDAKIGTPPPGMIASCIPMTSSALATFVPDPAEHC